MMWIIGARLSVDMVEGRRPNAIESNTTAGEVAAGSNTVGDTDALATALG